MTDRRTTLRPVRPATVARRRTELMETRPWPSAEDLDGWCVDMSGSPVKDEIQRAPSGPAAAPAVHQPARVGGDRRGRRSAAPVSRRHDARRGLRPRGLRPEDRRPHRGPADAGGLLGRGGAPGLRARMAAGLHGGTSASGISPRPAWATARSTPCYAWTRSSSPSSQTPPTASYRRSLGLADVRC